MEAFLAGRIAFLDIVDIVSAVVDDHVPPAQVTELDDVLGAGRLGAAACGRADRCGNRTAGVGRRRARATCL